MRQLFTIIILLLIAVPLYANDYYKAPGDHFYTEDYQSSPEYQEKHKQYYEDGKTNILEKKYRLEIPKYEDLPLVKNYRNKTKEYYEFFKKEKKKPLMERDFDGIERSRNVMWKALAELNNWTMGLKCSDPTPYNR